MENMLTQFFERPTPGKIDGKTRPLREITVEKKGRGQAGEGYHSQGSKKVSHEPYSLDQSYFNQHNALR